MKILMFFPGRIQHLPPLINAAINMAGLGAELTIVAFGASPDAQKQLTNELISLKIVAEEHPTSIIGKAYLWVKGIFLLYFLSIKIKPDYLWHHQCHYSMWYGYFGYILYKCKIIMHSHELTSHKWWRWQWQKLFARISDYVIVPEKNRGWILKLLSSSRARFVEIPNRNFFGGNLIEEKNSNELKDFFQTHGGNKHCKRFIIYQGAFFENRSLKEILLAFSAVKAPDVGLVLMGESNEFSRKLEKKFSMDKRILFLPFIEPPLHLKITNMCFAGILLYKPISLNSVYCAPNKIYEYASFGLGMLLPEYPGLMEINSKYNLGYMCDPSNVKSIKEGLEKLINRSETESREAANAFCRDSAKINELYKALYEEMSK